MLTALLATLLASACQKQDPPPPVLWQAPTFTLVDQQDQPYGSADLAGRVTVASFIYTNCPDICPLISANMSRAQDKLRQDGLLGSKVQLVSITVDPDRDTPAVLADYAAQYHADANDWRFLSGSRNDIFGLLAGFKLNTLESAQATAGEPVIPHSDRIAIVDSDGGVRGLLHGEDASPDDIVNAAKQVIGA